VFLGSGDGTFKPGQTIQSGTSGYVFFAVADINMDGNPDVLATGGEGLVALLGNGDGTFSTGPAIVNETGEPVSTRTANRI